MQSFMPNISNPLTEYIKKEVKNELKESSKQLDDDAGILVEIAADILDESKGPKKLY